MAKITKEVNEKSLNKSKKTSTSSNSVAKKVSTSTSSKKVASNNKKSVTKKNSSSKTTNQKKSTVSKNANSKKIPTKKSSAKEVKQPVNILEYYDLPYRYNKTIVKVLAQTPKRLFVYWDISDEDRKIYIKRFGENFFENTKPVLLIHNKTMNYTFEIEINDFANCWYFDIQDENCEYIVELGRRTKSNTINIPNNYLNITTSNQIESPNGHILFEKTQNLVFYRNIKTNEKYSKNITNLEFINRLGKLYNLNEMYKIIYKDEDFTNLKNPSSSINL